MTLAQLRQRDADAVDRLFDALSQGHVERARACCVPDAIFWHSFDCVAMNLDQIAQGWRDLVSNFPERQFVDVRREFTDSGLAQRHLMVAKRKDGQPSAWAICIFVRFRDGLIIRLDEYVDRSGTIAVGRDALTPGLDAHGGTHLI